MTRIAPIGPNNASIARANIATYIPANISRPRQILIFPIISRPCGYAVWMGRPLENFFKI